MTSAQPNPGPQSGPAPRRIQQRDTVEIARPIRLQLLSADHQPISDWIPADILDVSTGGLCLLLAEDASLPLEALMPLRLDVSSHRSFGVDQMLAQLRWIKRSDFVMTIGLVFETALESVPELES